MVRLLTHLICLSVTAGMALLLFGCGAIGKYDSAVAIEDPQPRGVVEVEDGGVLEVLDEDLAEFGNMVAEAFQKGDRKALWERFDEGVFFNRALSEKIAEIRNKEVAGDFVRDEVSGLVEDVITGLLGGVTESDLAFVRSEPLEGENHFKITLRQTTDWYFDYFILHVRVDNAGNYHVYDIEETVFLGESLSEFCLAFYGSLLDAFDLIPNAVVDEDKWKQAPNFVEQMNNLTAYSRIQQIARTGDYRRALASFYLIDTSVTQNFFAQRSLISILLAAGENHVDIQRTVEGLDRRWPEKLGTLNSMLVHYYNEQEYDKAMSVVEKLDGLVGPDVAWEISRAHLLCKKRQFKDAQEKLATLSTELGGVKSFYLELARAHAGLKDFEEVAVLLQGYEETFEEQLTQEELVVLDWGASFTLSEPGKTFLNRTDQE